ncbi:hypothetical protein CIB95_09210 [Lottiidibacillus patelloidae]|uniref:Uncharacterized protein n=1 Tax=Lottiidibacillus patelloidae TaxID=2670334 RepID=A0A263BTP6_9BACI|nr:hypothetical protein [Lottiidibacillus patelloidae]OZM56938.1 hypothetical protein CIB95_09210 [Lottiidibacillus patelloidae]
MENIQDESSRISTLQKEKKHLHEPQKSNPQLENTFTSEKINHIISSNIPSKEMQTWVHMKQLPTLQKKLLWHLIKISNKDNIALYQGVKQDLVGLIEKKLVIDNPIKMRMGISVFVLPYTPYLMRELKSLRNLF